MCFQCFLNFYVAIALVKNRISKITTDYIFFLACKITFLRNRQRKSGDEKQKCNKPISYIGLSIMGRNVCTY